MIKTRPLLRSGLSLGADQAIAQAGSFLRSVIIARLIGPTDFGIAAIFALTYSLLEMVSNLAAEALLVQADEGDNVEFQETIHFLQAGRGLANGLITVLIADPVSRLFGVPEARWAFMCLGAVPLIRGLTHTDHVRFHRAMRFTPSIAVNASTTVVITLASLPLGMWLRSYSVMVWILLLQAAWSTIVSHVVAERRYRWRWSAAHARRIAAFGWPLLINGLLMYLIFQGDRLVIATADTLFEGSSYSLADLGSYSLAFSLTLMPTIFVAYVISSLFLPVLSRVQKDPVAFERAYLMCTQTVCLVAAGVAVPLVLAGDWLVVRVYGGEYAPAAGVVAWLAAMQALRIVRVAPTVSAMALGDTKNAMIANGVRTLALAGVLFAAASGKPVTWIAACGFFGEALASVVGLWRLRRFHRIDLGHCVKPAAIAGTGVLVAALTHQMYGVALNWLVALVTSALLVATVSLWMLASYPRFRHDLYSLVR